MSTATQTITRMLVLMIPLVAAWLLWSGIYKPLLLGLGAFSCILVVWLVQWIAGWPLRRKVIVATMAFGLGFSLIFILLGASASFLGGLATRYYQFIRIGGGLLIIVFGLHLTGLLRLPFLEVEKRVQVREKPTHVVGTVLVGMAFGAGWSPCIGPMLGSILILAGSEESVLEGIVLLTVYSAGLWIPFLVMSVFINMMLVFLQKARRVMQFVNIAAGTLLIGLGFALVFDRFGMLWSLIAPAAG